MIENIKVIRNGYLIRSEKGLILDARSSVTLIQTEKSNILIDTSRRKDRDLIITGLKKKSLSCKDITIVINTHNHTDHTGNNDLFDSAVIFAHTLNEHIDGTTPIKRFPFELEKGIKIIETPGHSLDSISVVFTKKYTYTVAGDSIPLKNNLLNWIPPIINIGPELAIESMKKIISIADIIIPGHDFAFKIDKRLLEDKIK